MFSVTEIFVPHKEQQSEGEPRLLLSVLHKFYLFFLTNYKNQPMFSINLQL